MEHRGDAHADLDLSGFDVDEFGAHLRPGVPFDDRKQLRQCIRPRRAGGALGSDSRRDGSEAIWEVWRNAIRSVLVGRRVSGVAR